MDIRKDARGVLPYGQGLDQATIARGVGKGLEKVWDRVRKGEDGWTKER